MLTQAQKMVRPLLLTAAQKNISTTGMFLRSPFLEPVGALGYTAGVQAKSVGGASRVNGRFIHGTSARSLESIKKEGIQGQFYLTTNPQVAWNYAKKQADFDDSEKVIVIVDVDPSKMMKNEFDQYFVTGGDVSIKKSIKFSKKDAPESASELEVIAKRDAAGLRFQLQVMAVILAPSLFVMI